MTNVLLRLAYFQSILALSWETVVWLSPPASLTCIFSKVTVLFCSDYFWHLMLSPIIFNIKVWPVTAKWQHVETNINLSFNGGFFRLKILPLTVQMWSMFSIQCAYSGFKSGLRSLRCKAPPCRFICRLQRHRTKDIRFCGILSRFTHQVWEVLWMVSQMLQFAIVDKDL